MILIINTCDKKLSEYEFVKPICDIISDKLVIKHYSKLEDIDLDKADKVIICGTAIKDNKFLDYLDKFDWIQGFEKPILGICSGMQIIGLKFGASLIFNKEIGMKKIKIKKKNKLLNNMVDAYELHNNSLENLDEFEILAESNTSVQVIKHRVKDVYGVIFHPEVRNQNVVKNFINL